jgi:tetratricopeptide (TPR) repeat protein
MDRNRTTPHILVAVLGTTLALLAGGVELVAQLGPLLSPSQAPQARSQEELDVYLEVVTEKDPQKTVKRVESFAVEYPNSELLGIAYQYQAQAYVQLNDFEGVVAAGEKALRAHPDNLNTLLILAPILAEHAPRCPDQAKMLAQAEDYARRILVGAEQMQIPRKVPLASWEAEKARMQAQAHEALGVVAVQRGQPQASVSEFESAVRVSPNPQGDQFYRLGVAYASTGEKGKAEEALRRARDLGPDNVRQLALTELAKLTEKRSTAEQP